ncbi:MAG: glycosyltransferase family 2 protein, partial [Candidatus Nanopelagicales bacterium]|nr:glycosyltransferase family 2 protein [Candidatus Nanopelagicales bacterium]
IPAGWMGKQFACHRLSREARGSILVFLDADVTLEPQAVAACSELLRAGDFAMVAPYPRQLAAGIVERLVQPLVVWSWAATLPVGIAENSLRPSLSAANGQLLVVDSGKYHAIGGHESVQSVVLEDIALMRELKKSGERCVTVNGSALAKCRMYDTTTDLVEGYAKSLWSAFGSAAGSLAISALLATAYIAPAAGMLTSRKRSTRMVGALGYGAGVLSRGLVAHRTASPVLPDSLAHPASVATFIGLTALSWSRHLRGANTWKGRTL